MLGAETFINDHREGLITSRGYPQNYGIEAPRQHPTSLLRGSFEDRVIISQGLLLQEDHVVLQSEMQAGDEVD